ncbi:MAG TPA: ABC transporter ATP-binding protein [Solirubrobacteraceae bacterium]|nr:ABC transporter ATP-binding protein [Solirubrobacteraceae bacterium]
MSSLHMQQVVKRYRSGGETIIAVDEVSMEVQPGELVALYGPSGSGKTTLLLIAAGLMTPDEGEVLFDGLDLARCSSREGVIFRRREVGFVFQSFHLTPGASALDNTALKLLADGYSLNDAHAAAKPWLQRVGLGERLQNTPEQMSMGERQRVAIARALVNEPRLLLADEPTGSLDSMRSAQTLRLLREICHERGIPVLLVTHDPQASGFADRVHTLRDGRLTDGLNVDLASLAAP